MRYFLVHSAFFCFVLGILVLHIHIIFYLFVVTSIFAVRKFMLQNFTHNSIKFARHLRQKVSRTFRLVLHNVSL